MPRKKHFFYKFYVDRWDGDTNRKKLKRENSDTWHTVCNIMNKTRVAYIEGPREHMAKMLNLTEVEFDDFFLDLTTTGTAKTRVRRVKKVAPKVARGVARDVAQQEFFPKTVDIFRITCEWLIEEFKDSKTNDLPEGKKLREKLRGTKTVHARDASYELGVNKLQVNSSSEAEEDTHSLTSQPDTFRPPKGKTRRQVCEELSRDPKYKHIGGPGAIEHELKRCERWCSKNRCHPSLKKFKEKWLDRIWPQKEAAAANGNGNGNGAGKNGSHTSRRNGHAPDHGDDQETRPDRIGAKSL